MLHELKADCAAESHCSLVADPGVVELGDVEGFEDDTAFGAAAVEAGVSFGVGALVDFTSGSSSSPLATQSSGNADLHSEGPHHGL